MIFYLGAHHPNWLARLDVPLFVSRRALAAYRTLPRARVRWALDSGAFTELRLHGRWTVEPPAFAAEVSRIAAGVGLMEWASVQDWMCEPEMLERTGLTVEEHQRRTTANYLELRRIAPGIPWVPVLQGWELSDYHRHADAYEAAGVLLTWLPWVGVGSVCRRQSGQQAAEIMASLAARLGPRLHAFGFKATGLRECKRRGVELASADSMAWSYQARKRPPLPGCTAHKNCANCPRYALEWRSRLLESLAA